MKLFTVMAASLFMVWGAAMAQQPAQCPQGLPNGASCYGGQDDQGAFYLIAIPPQWNRTLMLHTHGGPSLKPPSAEDPAANLERFAVTVAEGFAWAGSSYRHAGYGVRDAAEDTERLRKIFWAKFGRPDRTFLHGQSWGAAVAAKTAELYGGGRSDKPIYDGVILTSGVLGGATRSYDFRADLRAVYQYYCHNDPQPGEPAYPLWQGLPTKGVLKSHELDARIDACTGIAHPSAERSAEQRRRLANILAVTRIPERTLLSHMNFATFTFRDLVQRQLHGHNPFSNVGVVYRGSDDDDALNAGVERFAADPQALRDLAFDGDPSGQLSVPTLTMHAEDDPTAFVELEAEYRAIVAKAGSSALLVQSFTREHEHTKLATPEYAALFQAMTDWVDRGSKPSPASLAARCGELAAAYGEECHFDPDFAPTPLSQRVYDRIKPPVAESP